MPAADRNGPDNNTQISERDKQKEPGPEREKNKAKSSAKVKDLSHVPCKFFKVGSCTAGSSCPFSHHLQEPGQHKDVCAWFVKGTCKFGHKCALAHILPGQSMAMDKKNKKAAQIAAGAGSGGGKDGSKGGKGQKRDAASTDDNAAPNRNPLLSGSTAPTRVLPPSARPPMTMPLKASISPSAPAPPLKDTDFTSLNLTEETDKKGTASAQRPPTNRTPVQAPQSSNAEFTPLSQDIPYPKPPPPLPVSTPRRAAVPQHRTHGSIDFGPIGSPPRASPIHATRMNGFSPGTSPSQGDGMTSTSPFSAPGPQSVFLSYDRRDTSSDFKSRSGIAASLGANRTWNVDMAQTSSKAINEPNKELLGSMALGGEMTVEEEDLEEFIPGSLTDLLTPEEKSRRMSRTHSGQGPAAVAMPVRDSSAMGSRTVIEGAQHRYSRSVPAPSLLSDIKSIWSDDGKLLPTVRDGGVGGAVNAQDLAMNLMLGIETPNSFKSNSAFGGRATGDDMLQTPHLAPSNASAAFLPGLHQHYLNSKTGNANARATLQNLHSTLGSGINHAATVTTTAMTATHLKARALSPTRGNPSINSGLQEASQDPYLSPGSFARAIPRTGNGATADLEDRKNALSPSTRALQAHAPGQSLPQGLAAGYSRIHALPPPLIPSPAAGGGFSPGQSSNLSSNDWSGIGGMLHSSGSTAHRNHAGSAGLDEMVSRLTYPGTASRGPSALSATLGQSQAARNPSGGRWTGQGAFTSPGRPLTTGDDDDLFSMDG